MESELPFKGEPETAGPPPSRPISRTESYLTIVKSIGDETLFLLLRGCALWVLWLFLTEVPYRTVIVMAGAAAVTAWYVLKIYESWRAFKAKPEAGTALTYRYVSRAQFFRLAMADKDLRTSSRIKVRYWLYLTIFISFVVELFSLFISAWTVFVLVSIPMVLPLRIFLAMVGLAAFGAFIRWRIQRNISYWRKPSMPYPMKPSAKLD